MKVAGFHFLIPGLVSAATPAAADTQPSLLKEGAVERSQVRTRRGSHEIVAEIYAAPNAGHAMLPEQPKAVGDAVLEFLSR
ncbi:MAG: hypothetical protein P8K76_12080 [Candidatus Binatia bacterium]|nr:hypothetical protein [Candidatus Binatia bacterium]MDG2010514.1 hypothetical protein [Candidatus Binatia bacterium]